MEHAKIREIKEYFKGYKNLQVEKQNKKIQKKPFKTSYTEKPLEVSFLPVTAATTNNRSCRYCCLCEANSW